MKSREILRRLVRRFGLLLLLTLIGGIAGATYAATKTPAYTAKAYVVAIGGPGESITALNFAQAYGRIATTGPILAQAGARLSDRGGLTKVTAATSPDAPVVEITATGTSAAHTADLANAVASALADYGSGRKAETKVSLSLLAAATVPAKPTSPKPPLELAVGAAGGLLIGGLAVLAGVGRAAVSRERTAQDEPVAEPYEDDVPEPEDVPLQAEIGRYTGVAYAQRPPKAITAYRTAALDVEEPEITQLVAEPEPEPVPVPATRIVGRAAVAGMEEDE